MTRVKTTRFYTLDGIRGLAAICVSLYHCEHIGIRVVPGGYLAVDFFFALSGFVIERAYGQRLRDGLRFTSFATTRLIRLYPLYLLGSMLGLAALVFGTDMTGVGEYNFRTALGAVIPAILMLPDPMTRYLYPANTPAWSLFFELAINFLFAAGLFRLQTRSLAALSLVSMLTFLALDRHYGNTNLGTIWQHLGGGAARVSATFLLGAVIARLHGPGRTTSWLSLVAVAALVGALNIEPTLRTDAAIIVLVIPCVLILASRFELPARLYPWCERLGDISYPLYAIHFPLLSLWARISRQCGLSPSSILAGFLLLAIGLAYGLVEVDARVRRRLSQLARLRPSAPAQII